MGVIAGMSSDANMADAAPPLDDAVLAYNGGPIASLDGFRSIAVSIVILSHVGLKHFVPGQFGVTLFFFLSGFLITTLLRREMMKDGDVDFANFYLRRTVRIIPPMYIIICLVLLASALNMHHPVNTHYLAYDFLFLTNYFDRTGVTINLWSLAVEEHFYMLFPAFFAFFATRLSFRKLAAICAALCCFFLAVRFYELANAADITRITFWTHTRMDSILFGCILALWNNPVIDVKDRLPGRLPAYAVGGLLLLLSFAIRDEAFRYTLRFSVQGLALLLIFNAAIRDRGIVYRILNNPVTAFIAALSYTLYLVDYMISVVLRHEFPGLDPVARALLIIAFSFLLAMAMRKFVEMPLLGWRKRVEAARKQRKLANPTLPTKI